MRGAERPFRQGNIEGNIDGNVLKFSVNYKFTESPMEPELTSTYEGRFIKK